MIFKYILTSEKWMQVILTLITKLFYQKLVLSGIMER